MTGRVGDLCFALPLGELCADGPDGFFVIAGFGSGCACVFALDAAVPAPASDVRLGFLVVALDGSVPAAVPTDDGAALAGPVLAAVAFPGEAFWGVRVEVGVRGSFGVTGDFTAGFVLLLLATGAFEVDIELGPDAFPFAPDEGAFDTGVFCFPPVLAGLLGLFTFPAVSLIS